METDIQLGKILDAVVSRKCLPLLLFPENISSKKIIMRDLLGQPACFYIVRFVVGNRIQNFVCVRPDRSKGVYALTYRLKLASIWTCIVYTLSGAVRG